MTIYVHVDKVENENLTQDDWNKLSQTVADISSTGMEGKADKNGSATEDFAGKKMKVHEDLTLKSGVAVDKFSDDGELLGNSDTTVPTEKAIKTYADTKALLAGDSGQDFATNHLTVNGNLEVLGTTISKDIEHMQGNVELGDDDNDTVKVAGTIKTAHSSGNLVIADDTNIRGNLSLNTGEAISQFSADANLTDNSDTAVPTQQAVKTYTDKQVGDHRAYTDNQLATKVEQTAWDNELSSITNQLAAKANINGSSSHDFAARDVTIAGNLSVQGDLDLGGAFNKMVPEAIEASLTRDVKLGSTDTHTVTIAGTLTSGHSSGHLMINQPLQVKDSTTAIQAFSTDGTLAGDSDTTVPTEKAVKTYVDSAQQAAQTYADEITVNSVINHTVNSASADDLNSLKTMGVYAVATSNPNLPADMTTDSDVNILTVYQHGTDNGVQILRGVNSDGNDKHVFAYQRSWHQQDWTAWQQTLYANKDGKVGIGTSQPTANLEVKGDLMLNNGVAIDQFSTDDTLASNSDTTVATEKAVKAYIDAAIAAAVPIGSLKYFAGTSAPADYLLCQGQSLLRTTYAGLFAVIGTAFGAADNQHFNLPPAGVFIRTVANGSNHDPDRDSRTAAAKGGHQGDRVGSLQAQGIPAHDHPIRLQRTHSDGGGHVPADGFAKAFRKNTSGYDQSAGSLLTDRTPNRESHVTERNQGVSDTRPVNIALHMMIKYQ